MLNASFQSVYSDQFLRLSQLQGHIYLGNCLMPATWSGHGFSDASSVLLPPEDDHHPGELSKQV